MTPRPPLVPDAIQPLTAYRMWSYVLVGRTATLHSMTCRGFGDCPWAKAPTEWVQSACNLIANAWHHSPDEECSCGIYAVPSIDELLIHFGPGLIGVGVGWVMGRVELAGKIIVHDFGFRAERARLVELVPLQEATPDLIRLGLRLRLPLAAPARAPMPELSPQDLELISNMARGDTTDDLAASTGLSKSQIFKRVERIVGTVTLRRPINPVLPSWPPNKLA